MDLPQYIIPDPMSLLKSKAGRAPGSEGFDDLYVGRFHEAHWYVNDLVFVS